MEEMWLARDEDGSLYLFFIEKPKKMSSLWNNQIDSWIEIDSHLFPEVQWSDEGPTKVKLEIVKQ